MVIIQSSAFRAAETNPPKENGKYLAVFDDMTLYVHVDSFRAFAAHLLFYEWEPEFEPAYIISPEYGKQAYNADFLKKHIN